MSRTKKTATQKSNAPISPATADRRKPKAATTVGKTNRRTKALGDNGIPPWRIVLQGAVRTFNDLCSEYEAAKNGYRVSLYKFAEQCYKVGNAFNTRTDQFARFKDDPFWAKVRQKPRDDKKMRAVLVYATKSNPGAFASLITKTAKVLEDMATRGVKASDVAKRLRGCLETNFMISRAFRRSASLAIRPRPRKTEQSQVQYKRAGPNFL